MSDTYTCRASFGRCLSMSACKQKGAALLLQFSVSGVSTLSCNALTHTIKDRHQSSPERIIVHIGFSLNSGNALTHSIKVRHQSSPDRIIMHVGFGLFPQGRGKQCKQSWAQLGILNCVSSWRCTNIPILKEGSCSVMEFAAVNLMQKRPGD